MEIILDFTGAAGTSGPGVSGDSTTYIFLAGSDAVNTGGSASPIIADLDDVDGVATGISFFQTTAPSSSTGSSGTAAPYDGDAVWMNIDAANDLGSRYWFTGVGETRVVGFGNLDPTKTYRVEAFSARGTTGSRFTDWTIGTTTETIEAIANTSATAIFTGISPDGSNQILITSEEGGGDNTFGYQNALRLVEETASAPTTRKGSTFDIETTLGTITTATLDSVNVFDHVTGQTGSTVSFAGAATDEITTSGTYTLTLGDGSSTEDITVQVNVIGLPVYTLNKSGSPLGNLTGVKALVTATGELDGAELYTANDLTATAGVLDSNIEIQTGAVGDPVTVTILTGANEGVSVETTLELL